MTVDFETKFEQTALDYIKIHLQEGYLVTAYKDVGNYYWESVYKIRASLSTNRKTENSSEKPNNCKTEPQIGYCNECKWFRDKQVCGRCRSKNLYAPKDEPQTDCGDFADRLAYERGVEHAWEVAQKVFDSTVTFYEAEDLAKWTERSER